MANDNPAKLGRRHSYNLRLPQADAYPLLAGRRAEGDNPISAPRCPPSSYAKDSEVWTDQFGDAAMINGVPFDTTKHLAKIDVEDPESLAVGAVVGELVTKQPKEFFATLYKDSFNGTPIAPEPTKQTFPGFGSLEASFSVDKGKMQGEATFTLSPEIVAKLGENFFAELRDDLRGQREGRRELLR